MSKARGPTPEDVTREYQAKLAAAVRARYTNADLMEAWMEYQRPALAERTRSSWETFAKHGLEWLTKKKHHALSVTRNEALGFVSWLEAGEYEGRRNDAGKLAASTILNHLTFLDLMYDYLRDVRGLLTVNPFAGVVKVFIKQHKSELRPELRGMDEQETAIMLEGAEKLDELLTGVFLFKSGVRREEFVKIRTDRIN